MTEVLPVIQADRENAYTLMIEIGRVSPLYRDAIMRGEWDEASEEIKAFARHRIAGQAELVEAAHEVLSHRVGDLPTRGWLKDNDGSRASLSKLAAALQPLSQAGGGRG